MPKSRKCYHRNSLVEICFRTEQGLPLVATPYMKVLIESILARAQTMYPVRIVAFVVMGNHIHIMIVVKLPGDVPHFKEYVKRELAHAINDLLGRINHTVWVDGCDDPVILDPEKALSRLLYIYTNPQKSDLEETIEKYPNLSTWESFLAGGSVVTCKRISRTSVPCLPRRTLSLVEQQQIADQLIAEGHEEFELVIEPDAWIDCYPQLEEANPELLRDALISEVRAKEKEFSSTRVKPVIGAHALRFQSMRKEYLPKKRGKKMLCLGSIRKHRVAYITWRTELHERARDVFRKWKQGVVSAVMPPGMFWPGGHLAAPCEISMSEFCADF